MSTKEISFLAAAAEARTQVADLQRPMLPDELVAEFLAAKARVAALSKRIRREMTGRTPTEELEAALEANEAAGVALDKAVGLARPAVMRALDLVSKGECDSPSLAALAALYPDRDWAEMNDFHGATVALAAIDIGMTAAAAEKHLAKLQRIYPDEAARMRANFQRIDELRRFDSRKLGIAPTNFPTTETENHNTTTP